MLYLIDLKRGSIGHLQELAADSAMRLVVLGTLDAPPKSIDAGLSQREIEVLELLVRGKSNQQIGLALGIRHQTVKNHMSTIYRKLQVEDRVQAAVYGLQLGLIGTE